MSALVAALVRSNVHFQTALCLVLIMRKIFFFLFFFVKLLHLLFNRVEHLEPW